MKTTLVTRDSKGKCRVLEFNLILNQDNTYTIKRYSSQLGGKIVEQPELLITAGKVKRSIKEQSELEYNSLIKKAKDKGYKDIVDLGISNLNEVEEKLSKDVVDQNNVKKPMLCKVYDKDDPKYQGKTWYISKKHDGVRAFLYYKDGEIRTASRGGQDYDIPATYIRNDDFLKQLFENNNNLVLDGELYRHFWPLSKVSGLCRLETLTEEHEEIKFHCYDIVDETLTFKERLSILNDIADKCCNIDTKLVIVDHYLINNDSEIFEYHDKFVGEGYEGAVIRDADQKYKCGSRDRRMAKIKQFTSAEFKIKGLVDGLRDEALCFLMETEEGYEFKAKPIGDRTLKQYYKEHENEFAGQYGTVKYFGFTTTDTPVPNLPVFIAIRDKKDI